ncbi:hypothetical protein AWF67_26360 [Escherichia coli]|nr:hypothetical protein AWF67_26360 [Escherichia coli]
MTTLFRPECRITLPGFTFAVLLILFHYISERRKRRSRRWFATQQCAVNIGDLACNGRETEAIDQQMVITLIPVPAVIRHLYQLMKDQWFTTIDAQILLQIRLH